MPDSSTAGSRRSLETLTLGATWALVTGLLVAALALGARQSGALESWGALPQAVYVAALLWYLARTGPPLGSLPEAGPSWARRSRIGRFLAATAVALLLALSVLSDAGGDLVLFTILGAALGIPIAWHREVRLWRVAVGLALAGTAFLAGLPAWGREVISDTALVLLPALVLPIFVAGGLLIDRTRLGESPLHRGRWPAASASFLRGCALFLPLGLVNAVDDSPGTTLGWVTEAWMPLVLPLFSGISEEAWFRLLLVPLVYFLLRPALGERPRTAVVCALLFSAIVFGLGHGRSADRLLTTGLLYGLPMAAVFASRDWEHAVGAHYMINLVPWGMAFVES